MADAEALLLVHDEKAQVLELDVLLEELVGADEEVDPSGPEVREDLPGLAGGLEPGEDPDLHRETAEAVDGGVEVLLGQDGGGHQNGGLLAVQHALHHRPEGHFGFAVAHVAAEEPVHGHRPLHVLFDLLDAPQLVVGLRVVKGLLELPLPGGVGGEGEARPALALGVEGDEALGQVLGGSLGPGLLLGPVGAPQLVELGGAVAVLPAAADVLGHQVQLGGGDIEAVAAGVGDLDVVLFHPVHRHFPHALKAADAVVGVDHQVPGGEVGVAEELLAAVLFGGAAGGGLPGGGGGELPLGEDGQAQLGVLRPGGEGSHGQAHLPGPGQGAAVKVQGGGDAPLLEHPLEVLGPGGVAAQQQGPEAGAAVVLQVPGSSVQAAAVGAQLLGADGEEGPGVEGIAGGGQGLHHAYREPLQLGEPLALAEEEPREIASRLPGGQEGLGVLPCLEEDGFHPLGDAARLAQADEGVGGQAAEGGGGGRPLRQLRRRQHQGGGEVLRPALGGGVEGAQGVDLVVEELAAHRLVHLGGEHVQDASPKGELAHALHLVAAGVPGGYQPQGQLGKIPPAADLQGEGAVQELPGGGGLLKEALGGAHRQAALPPGQGVEGGDPGGLPLTGGHGPGPDEQLPGAEPQGGEAQKGLQVAGQAARLPLVGADHHQGPSGAAGQGGGQLGLVDGGQARHRRGAAALFHGLRQGGGLGDLQQFLQQQLHGRLLSRGKNRGTQEKAHTIAPGGGVCAAAYRSYHPARRAAGAGAGYPAPCDRIGFFPRCQGETGGFPPAAP